MSIQVSNLQSNPSSELIKPSAKRVKLSQEKMAIVTQTIFIEERQFVLTRSLWDKKSSYFARLALTNLTMFNVDPTIFEKIHTFVERGVLDIKGCSFIKVSQLVNQAQIFKIPDLEEECFDRLEKLTAGKEEFKRVYQRFHLFLPWLDSHVTRLQKVVKVQMEEINNAKLGLSLNIVDLSESDNKKLSVSLDGVLKKQGFELLQKIWSKVHSLDLSHFPLYYRDKDPSTLKTHVEELLKKSFPRVVFRSSPLFLPNDLKILSSFSEFLTELSLQHKMAKIDENVLCEFLRKCKRVCSLSLFSCSQNVYLAVQSLYQGNSKMEFFIKEEKKDLSENFK